MLREKDINNENHLIEVESYVDDKIEIAVISNDIENSIFLDKELSNKLVQAKEDFKNNIHDLYFKTTCAESDHDWLTLKGNKDNSFCIEAFNTINDEQNKLSLTTEQILKVINEVEVLQVV